MLISQEQQEEWVKKLKFHAGLAPSKQLTSYSSAINNSTASPQEDAESVATDGMPSSEPLYANLPSPPLPNSGPPPPAASYRHSASVGSGEPPVGFGVAGTRDLLNQKAGSREPIAGEN